MELDDNWWHLAVGRWIATHHQVPTQDPFPYSNEKKQWLDTHWLGSLSFFKIYQWVGFLGLKFSRAFYFQIIIGIFFFYFYRRIPFFLLFLLSCLISFGLYTRCLLRPDIFNLSGLIPRGLPRCGE
jgi:hypothetical protein